MRLSVLAAVFPLVFIAELPDKTMFASVLLASRGRPLAVWVGASLAFALHVAIAVTVGVVAFRLLSHRAVEGVVAGMFLAGAVYAFLSRPEHTPTNKVSDRSGWMVAATAALVIFIAEWGDLTQILTANLAADYHQWPSVAVGALAALVSVAALAVVSGSRLLGNLPVRPLRVVTGFVLLGLAAYSAVQAI